MPLTPADVLNAEFPRTLRGYDPAAVDEFHEAVAAALTDLIEANERLATAVDKAVTVAPMALLSTAAAVADDHIAQARTQADQILVAAANAVAEAASATADTSSGPDSPLLPADAVRGQLALPYPSH